MSETFTQDGNRVGGCAGSTGSEIFFWRLDALSDRANKLMSLAVDACRAERWTAYKWLIREYRRKRLLWHAEAVRHGVSESACHSEWSCSPHDYMDYLDTCRETFGLAVRHRLAPLPGAEQRKEEFISSFDQEIEEDRKKYDPYYLNTESSQP